LPKPMPLRVCSAMSISGQTLSHSLVHHHTDGDLALVEGMSKKNAVTTTIPPYAAPWNIKGDLNFFCVWTGV
jgi:hypothetical protein